MIQLTEKVIAVEVPNDATDVSISIGLGEDVELTWMSESCGYDIIVIDENWVSLIGVTPLSYETWCIQVFFDEYDKGDITHGDDIAILLESKGLDVNKKYAIIKIEK